MNDVQVPHKSFCIWFTPRTGSTLLCKSLEETGIAGKAGEFLNIPEDKSLCKHYNVSNYEDLKYSLWQLGTSRNGVMGVKFSLYKSIYDHLSKEMMILRGLNEHPSNWQIWSDIFPNCKHIFLTRRNKIRVAVSWWKAIQDQKWHVLSKEQYDTPEDFYKDKYDFDALMHLLKETNLREAATESFFQHNRITPYTVIYEDFIRNYELTIFNILNFLDEDSTHLGKLPTQYYKPTANQITEQWVQRFRNQIQENWDRKMY